VSSAGPRPDDDDLWAAVEATVRDVLLPDLRDEWARAAAVQLVGLARHARERPADRSAERDEELAAVLDALAAQENEIVARVWPQADTGIHDAVARCLAAAVVRDDEAAAAVRSQLRPVVVAHLDDDLAATSPLLDYFRGRLPDA
jgi:hypothetical protein